MTIKSIVGGSVGSQNLISLGLAGVIKPFTEGFIARTPVGDGNLISGVAKMVGGVLAHKFLGEGLIQNALVAALIVDGGEDVARGVMGGGLFGGNQDAW
jgi:hypothetical protein